jgi:toxin ParE1/3/4
VKFRTEYSPRAERQLRDLYDYIAQVSGRERANAFVGSITDYCEGLAASPYRGTKRDDLRQGMRTLGFRRRVTILFSVRERVVEILGVFYGGRSFQPGTIDE